MRTVRLWSVLFLFMICLSPVQQIRAHATDLSYSRLVIYDVRGVRQEETAIILEQKGKQVTVWLKNYLGRRTGSVPYEEYQACFNEMRAIRGFAIKKRYRGHLLRRNAAKGILTLAWKDDAGKQIRTIKYYAPEHTLDDFRAAFNRIWALSRYAILSTSSFESPQIEFLEDAVYFLSGAGWMTRKEIESVIAYHVTRNQGRRIAKAIWGALDQRYSRTSEFRQRSYLEYCVTKGMVFLGEPAKTYLMEKQPSATGRKQELIRTILDKIESP